jgi:hypothetical protein
LEISIHKSDGKQYTFILKDELLPKSPSGREQSTVGLPNLEALSCFLGFLVLSNQLRIW